MTSAISPWVNDLTFSQVLDQTVERLGDSPAVVFPQHAYRRNYGEFRSDVHTAARALLSLGVQRGEHIGLWSTNWPQWVTLQFAAAEIGAVLVNINPAYRAKELSYVLNQADITTLFLTDRFKTSDYFAILEEICPEVVPLTLPSPPGGEGRVRGTDELRSAACPKLRRLISIKNESRKGYLTWGDFLDRASTVAQDQLEARRKKVKPDDVVNIQYTSGTTGFPKGAMLTHRNLLLNAFYVGERLRMTERDRLCIPVPFYHCFGCVLGTLLCVVCKSAIVAPAEVFDPLATLQAIQDERCTVVYGVPTMFIAQLNHPRFAEFDLSSLRTGIMAGSPCPIEVMRAVVDKMGARDITIAYGLTEASPAITQTKTSDSLEHRVATVGTALPGLEVRIVEPGSLEPAPTGQPGELLTRGHCVMKGYYNKPKETAEAITPDGWLHTGDLAVHTDDGFYRITGRIKDMIIRGGENVYPREIEEFLYTHPGVADVQVVGLPDEKYVEEISAWIRLKPGAAATEEGIRSFCQGQIAHYKIPRYVIFVEEYPTTVTGKVQKFKLREMGIQRFGL